MPKTKPICQRKISIVKATRGKTMPCMFIYGIEDFSPEEMSDIIEILERERQIALTQRKLLMESYVTS